MYSSFWDLGVEGWLLGLSPLQALLNHFAAHSPLVKDGQRLAAVFGVDNLAGASQFFGGSIIKGPTPWTLPSPKPEALNPKAKALDHPQSPSPLLGMLPFLREGKG